jgi:hypothetical protein
MSGQRLIRAGAVLAGVVALSGQLAGCSSSASVAPKPDLSAPPPVLAKFVPVPDRVLSVTQMLLDPSLPQAVVVISVAPAVANKGMGYPIDTVRVLAWDIFAKRWTMVFNSATAQFPVIFPLDAVDDLYDVTAAPPPLSSASPPPLADLVDAQVAPIADQPHGGVDLAFEGVDGGSAVGTQLAGIVHFAEGVATVEWAYEARDIGTFSVIGKAPDQQLAFEHSQWITPADPECCGVRTFRFVVAKTAEAGGYGYYSVVSDNRSWLGAWIVPNSEIGTVDEVLSITPGSPASQVLKPGDILKGVVGTPPRQALLGAAVIDELAEHLAGSAVTLEFERDGRPRRARVTLGSRDNKQAVSAPTPDPGYLDIYGLTMTPELAIKYSLANVPGVLLTKVVSGGAAAAAGLVAGDVIEDVGSVATPSYNVLSLAEVQVGANSSAIVQYVNSQGVQHTVTVTLGSTPADNSIWGLAYV